MLEVIGRIDEFGPLSPERFAAEVEPRGRPAILRGLVADWPAVAAAREGDAAMADYILGFDRGLPVDVMVAAPDVDGRFFYNETMDGWNFHRSKAPLRTLLDQLLAFADSAAPPAMYAGAAAANDFLPGWLDANPLPLPTPDSTPRIWIGNATRVSTHYDISDNVACVIAGRRRFTLFPPEQLPNLYVGPLDVTIAGQPASMVDIDAPDLERFPRFADALPHALVADLEPGDAIYMPSMWWHAVRATAPFNVLFNYWYGQPLDTSPFGALIHALMAVRDLPAGPRTAMREWFEHYVFSDDACHVADHLPPAARGVLGPESPERTKVIKDYLIRVLSRG